MRQRGGHIGKRPPLSQIHGSPAVLYQKRDPLSRVVGARECRIVAMIRGDDQQVIAGAGRQKS